MAEADDLRQFMRDMNTRADRRTDAIVRRLDDQAAAMREQAAETRDMRAQIRANTEGLLRVLDELRGPA
ncbi:MAG TPA: hypothetical protein VF715_06315 [Thermoleophilaceae bacterium]